MSDYEPTEAEIEAAELRWDRDEEDPDSMWRDNWARAHARWIATHYVPRERYERELAEARELRSVAFCTGWSAHLGIFFPRDAKCPLCAALREHERQLADAHREKLAALRERDEALNRLTPTQFVPPEKVLRDEIARELFVAGSEATADEAFRAADAFVAELRKRGQG